MCWTPWPISLRYKCTWPRHWHRSWRSWLVHGAMVIHGDPWCHGGWNASRRPTSDRALLMGRYTWLWSFLGCDNQKPCAGVATKRLMRIMPLWQTQQINQIPKCAIWVALKPQKNMFFFVSPLLANTHHLDLPLQIQHLALPEWVSRLFSIPSLYG